MGNMTKGEVSLDFEGRSYIVRLDFNALAEFEDATGENALQVLGGGKLSVSLMRSLFWCGLRQEHPEITIQEAGRILTANISKFDGIVAGAFPDTPDDAGDGKKSRRATTRR